MASALEVSLDNFLFDLYLEQKLLVTGTHFDERSYNMYMHVWLFFWPGVVFIEKLRKGHYIVLSVTDVYNMVVHLAN